MSKGMVIGITNKLLPEIEAWKKRPLSSVYPIVFIDAIEFNEMEDNVIQKRAAYNVNTHLAFFRQELVLQQHP